MQSTSPDAHLTTAVPPTTFILQQLPFTRILTPPFHEIQKMTILMSHTRLENEKIVKILKSVRGGVKTRVKLPASFITQTIISAHPA